MPLYKVVAGSYRAADGVRYMKGETVELPEQQAERHALTLERVVTDPDEADVQSDDAAADSDDAAGDLPSASTEPDVSDSHEHTDPVSPTDTDEAEAESDTADADAVEDEPEPPAGAEADDVGDTTPTPDVPDDYTLLSQMAAAYDGDEVNGAMTADEITSFFEQLTPTEVNGLKRAVRQ